jgi:hypothetical protein
MTSNNRINGENIRSNTNNCYGIDPNKTSWSRTSWSKISWSRFSWKIIVSIEKFFWTMGTAVGLALLAVMPLPPMVLLLAALPLVLAAVEPRRIKKSRRAASWR